MKLKRECYYECCACQAVHHEGDALFEEHKDRQSKHGIMGDLVLEKAP